MAFTLPQNSPNVQLIVIPSTVVVSVASAKHIGVNNEMVLCGRQSVIGFSLSSGECCTKSRYLG